MSQVEDAEQGLRFPDQRQVPEKAFELHLRKDLSRLIKKCQGMCGKVIWPDDDGKLVKSYGTSPWTDRKIGEEPKFGSMYIHFNSQFLETFDREDNYGPKKRFDYKRIKVKNKTQEKLTEAEKEFLIKIVITFPYS